MSELRSTAQRKADVLATLERQGHAWLATASRSGVPHLISVAAVWDGTSIIIATRGPSQTARNLDAGRRARLAFGPSDDAMVVDVELAATLPAADGGDTEALFERAAGWSPAQEGPDWRFFVLRPTRIQAYRGYGELEGRDVMKGGTWLA
jgi:pyridoxamine 5'-phosphate oxidase-like protein